MPYTPYYAAWEDDPSTDTPISAAALQNIENGLVAAAAKADGAIQDVTHVTNGPLYWNGSAWVSDTIKNAQIASDAAIAVSKLAAGSNGDVLKTTAGVPTWGVPSMALLETIDVSAASATTVSLAGYNSLHIKAVTRSPSGPPALGLLMRFNGDSGNNYSEEILYGWDSAAVAAGTSATNWLDIGVTSGSAGDTGAHGVSVVDVIGYALTANWKTAISYSTVIPAAGASTNYWFQARGATWRNTAAVTSLQFGFASGSLGSGSGASGRIWVYGVN